MKSQRRINGPAESSFPYNLFVRKPKEATDEKAPELKTRKDSSRTPDQSREIGIQLGVISKAKGSCYVELGKTKIIAAVFELREIPRQNKYADKGQLHCDFKYSQFSRNNRKSVTESEEKLMSASIKTAVSSAICLHEFPNYQVDVFINILEDDGSVLAGSIIAAGVAFSDASIPMYDLITASTVGILNGTFIVDPNSEEEEMIKNAVSNNHGTLTISSLASLDQISHISVDGFWESNSLKQAKQKGIEINKKLIPYIKKTISQKMYKRLKDAD